MEYEDLFKKITAWAHDRGIDQADPRVEFMKMAEELGELSAAYNKEHHAKMVDSIGDLQVALLIFASWSASTTRKRLKRPTTKLRTGPVRRPPRGCSLSRATCTINAF